MDLPLHITPHAWGAMLLGSEVSGLLLLLEAAECSYRPAYDMLHVGCQWGGVGGYLLLYCRSFLCLKVQCRNAKDATR
jgi:hypothetical protein